MNRHTMTMRFLLWLALAALAAGCAHAPPTVVPEAAPHSADAAQADWWAGFGDAGLQAAVAAVQARNHDLAAASARARQAEAQARIDGALLWPAVTASLGARRDHRLGGNAMVAGASHAIGLAASYEVDLWGRQRATQRGALEDLRASCFDLAALRIGASAGVASAWLRAAGLQERVAIARLNQRDAERLLALIEARHLAGAATPLELEQQRGIVAAQRRTADALREAEADSRVELAAWLGEREPVAPLAPGSLERLRPPRVDVGLRSELLLRRPDIARAEARLAAADARVEAARAAMFPSLVLTAALGSADGRLRGLFDNPVYGIGAALAAPIFDAGRLAAGRDLAQARREELLADYRAAIVNAFADTQTALHAVEGLEAQIASQAGELAAAVRSRVLAETRYRAGAESLITLLDAQRTLHAAQDHAAQLRMARLQASVGLYRALGGGWRAGD